MSLATLFDQDWTLQKRIIAFRMMEYPHSGQNIYNHVMSGISERIFSITFDNASANDYSIKIFQRNLTPPHGGKFYHIRCCCHILNLIVQDGMQVFNVHIQKIRDAILFLRSSNARISDFRKFCQSLEIKPIRFATDTQNQ